MEFVRIDCMNGLDILQISKPFISRVVFHALAHWDGWAGKVNALPRATHERALNRPSERLSPPQRLSFPACTSFTTIHPLTCLAYLAIDTPRPYTMLPY